MLILVASASGTAAEPCDALGDSVQVTVRTDPGTVAYRTAHTRSDLMALQRQYGGGQAGSAGGHPLGLTSATFQAALLTRVRLLQISAERYCAALAAVEVTLSYDTFEVYIDRRYPRGSCEYEAILHHENEHVRLYRRSLKLSKEGVRAAVIEAARQIQPIIVTVPDRASTILQARVNRMIQPAIARLGADADRANASIDTPDNYRSVQRRCVSW